MSKRTRTGLILFCYALAVFMFMNLLFVDFDSFNVGEKFMVIVAAVIAASGFAIAIGNVVGG